MEGKWDFGQLLYAEGGEGTRLVGNSKDLLDANIPIFNKFEIKDISFRTFGHGCSLRLAGSVPYGEVEVVWTLPKHKKKIDVTYKYHKDERLEKEAVYIAFPMKIQNANVLSDSQIGWVNWNEDQLPGGVRSGFPYKQVY